MVQISKETQEFIDVIGQERRKVLSAIPPSADRMTPGDILVFRYWVPPTRLAPGTRGQRIVLVVKTRRGDGIFTSTQDNLLVSCFKLQGHSEVVIDTILDNLYKKRRRASYYGKIKQSLVSILGKGSFRTYRLDQMKSINKVAIK